MTSSARLLVIAVALLCGINQLLLVKSAPTRSISSGSRGGSSKRMESKLMDWQKKLILATHHKFRANINPPASRMEYLQWDDELASSAQYWAEQCIVGHDHEWDRNTTLWDWVGQNIAKGYGDDLVHLMDMWDEEKNWYDFDTNTCEKTKDCGHYTQLVWGTTTHVGCGFAECDGTDQYWGTLVCNYGPGGNVRPYGPYRAGDPCTSCKGYGKCKDNQCFSLE